MVRKIDVGMNVTVDVSGLTKNGAPLGVATTAGTIMAFGHEGVTVQLDTTVAGVNVVTVPPDRVTAAE